MAMNTTVNTGNITQVSRTNPTINANPKIVTNDSYSPFQPETQVDFENSIKNMLTNLEKTALNKGMPPQGLPEEVQKLVDALMKNAFSLDMSLSQGLSDVLQSQKFTLDQLNLLAKFLDQISVLVDSNEISNLPDSLKTLLGNINLLAGEDGKLIDGMVLNKLAFQLLEGKHIADLPEVLQFLLTNNSANVSINTPQSNELSFLKQLVQYFMPSPAETEEVPGKTANPNNQANQNNTANNQQGAQGTNQTVGQKANGQQTQNIPLNQNSAAMQQQGGQNQTIAGQKQNAQQSQMLGNQNNEKNLTAKSNQTPLSDNNNSSINQQENHLGKNLNAQNRPPLQNTPQVMQMMKSLAGQMLKNPSFTENEVNLLKNFINGNQKILNEQEVKQLQILIRMSEDNIPASIRQAAAKQDLPNLPKLWAFVQLCNLTRLLDLQAERLRNSSKNINDFATVLKKAMNNENEVSGNQRSMSFMTPLYLGDNEKCYPTYIHIYNETSGDGSNDEEMKETWLRLCLLTENIGAVELVFRLYEKNNVNLRVAFSSQDTVDSFNECIPDLRTAFAELPLILNDIKVSAIGG